MTATICAWCKVNASMILFGGTQYERPNPADELNWIQQAFTCSNCRKISVASSRFNLSKNVFNSTDPSWWDGLTLSWQPTSVGGKEFPDVPTHIASAADESYRNYSIGAFRSAILMGRSVIEATAKDLNITSGTLAAKIDELFAKSLIRSHTKDAAHELRFLGNDMAHGDFVDEIDAEDAESVLDITSEILNEVYQGPARVARMKTKRTEKRDSKLGGNNP